jgi:hypothetical protein
MSEVLLTINKIIFARVKGDNGGPIPGISWLELHHSEEPHIAVVSITDTDIAFGLKPGATRKFPYNRRVYTAEHLKE